MFDAFASFPDTARLWLMAFPRPLDEGEQVKLAKDRAESMKAFHALKALPDETAAKSYRPTFRKIADEYLTYTQQTKSSITYKHQMNLPTFGGHRVKGVNSH